MLDLQLQSQFMTARNNSRMHLPFFCKSLSECEYTFGITITVLKISQNNENRGRHLEFYSHTGIGNWFQCFPVLSLNLSSGSGSVSGSDSGFRFFHTPFLSTHNMNRQKSIATDYGFNNEKTLTVPLGNVSKLLSPFSPLSLLSLL